MTISGYKKLSSQIRKYPRLQTKEICELYLSIFNNDHENLLTLIQECPILQTQTVVDFYLSAKFGTGRTPVPNLSDDYHSQGDGKNSPIYLDRSN